jgi:hypothetical protein
MNRFERAGASYPEVRVVDNGDTVILRYEVKNKDGERELVCGANLAKQMASSDVEREIKRFVQRAESLIEDRRVGIADVHIDEKIVSRYEMRYDKIKLEEAGFDSIQEYVEKEGPNIWELEGEGIITEVTGDGVVDYLDVFWDTMEIETE